MFGLCALSKKLLLVAVVLLLPGVAAAQSAQNATVVLEGALVYKDADFDSPVITTLKRGAVYRISKKTKGPFHKIRIKSGMIGWIADVDVKPGIVKMAPPPPPPPSQELTPLEGEGIPKTKPFYASRYRGPVLTMIDYAEVTFGKERSAPTLFYGLKFNGFNTMFSGEIYTDANLIFSSGAPEYYSKLTGRGSEGFIFIADFLLQTVLPQNKWLLFFYGFGPMFKYSHYKLEVPDGGTTTMYSADDMNLGAVFDLGWGARMGKASLRADVKYYWEKTKYWGYGFNFGWEF